MECDGALVSCEQLDTTAERTLLQGDGFPQLGHPSLSHNAYACWVLDSASLLPG